jgi:hypothetical protein
MKDKEEVYFNSSGLKVTGQYIDASSSPHKNYVEKRSYSINEVISVKRERKQEPIHPILWGLHIVISGIMTFDLYKIYYQTNIFFFIIILICVSCIWSLNFILTASVSRRNTLKTAVLLGMSAFLGFGIVPRAFFYLFVLITTIALLIESDAVRMELVIIGTTSDNYTVGAFKKVEEANLAVQAIEKAIEKKQNQINLRENSYSLRVSGETYGPYDLDTVRHLFTTRQINPNGCLFWKPGMIEWTPITEIRQLRELIPPSTLENIQKPTETISKKTEKQYSSQQEKAVEFEPVEFEPVDLNNAPLEDLLLLPNMTINKAENLIRERELRLGFSSIEEVAEFLQLQPHLVTKLKAKAVILAYQSENISDAQDQRLIDF